MKKWTKELLEENGYEIENAKYKRWLSRLEAKEQSDE